MIKRWLTASRGTADFEARVHVISLCGAGLFGVVMLLVLY